MKKESNLTPRPLPVKPDEVEGLKTFRLQIHINAPKAKVWEVLAVKFGEIDKWSPAIAESHYTTPGEGCEGAVRVCKPEGTNFTPVERLTKWQEGKYMQVVHEEKDGPFRAFIAESWLEEDATGTKLTVDGHFRGKFPMNLFMGIGMMKKQTLKQLIGLKHYIATGEAVNAKNFDQIAKRYSEVWKEALR